MPKAMTVPKGGQIMVKKLYALMIREGCSLQQLQDRSGVSYHTVDSWRRKRVPSLANFEACINALGYKLSIVMKREDEI